MNRNERIVTNILAVIGIGLALALCFLLSGCGTLTLRPMQRNHDERMAEVRARLNTDDAHLSVMLASTQEECDSLDARATGWTASSVVVGVLGGGSGAASLFTDSTPRYVVGGVGVGLSAVSALSAYMSVHTAQQYARKCSVNTGGF